MTEPRLQSINPPAGGLLMTTYSAGLRVGETVQLNLHHVESSCMMIRVEQGKGKKDRYTLLPECVLEELRDYYRAYSPKVWLFPGKRDPQKHLSVEAAKRAFYVARDRGESSNLENKTEFKQLMDSLWQKEWVVYSKKPFDKPEKVLEYMARYTHRVAISNNRILDVTNGKITFKYKDRRYGNQSKTINLSAHEFIRRFLLHILPAGLMRIRYFGFMANRCKKDTLPIIRELLGVTSPPSKQEKLTTEKLIQLFMGIDVRQCPICKDRTMVRVGLIIRAPPTCHELPLPQKG